MGNLVLNKPAAASSFVLPYAPGRAVDGITAPTSRWECSRLPGSMMVDLGAGYWINRWVVRHMGTVWDTNTYNMTDFTLQGSNDGNTWSVVDGVTGNNAPVTDRMFSTVQYRYVRLNVTKGINCNTQLASCMELEVYEAPPTSSNLSALTISAGTLTPAFSSGTVSYTDMVTYDTANVTVTPTSEDGATIKVNGTSVASGTASQPIPLNAGSNTITIQVTSRIGSVVKTYTVAVTKPENPYLTGLTVSDSHGALSMDPGFSPTVLQYKVNTVYSLQSTVNTYAITLTPSAAPTAVIKVNGAIVASGQASQPINLNVGSNTITVQVITANGTVTNTYTVTAVRSSNAYLTNLVMNAGRPVVPLNPAFNADTVNYTAALASTVAAVTVTPTAADSAAVITVNDVVVQSTKTSSSISVSNGTVIRVKVTPATGAVAQNYQITIQK